MSFLACLWRNTIVVFMSMTPSDSSFNEILIDTCGAENRWIFATGWPYFVKRNSRKILLWLAQKFLHLLASSPYFYNQNFNDKCSIASSRIMPGKELMPHVEISVCVSLMRGGMCRPTWCPTRVSTSPWRRTRRSFPPRRRTTSSCPSRRSRTRASSRPTRWSSATRATASTWHAACCTGATSSPRTWTPPSPPSRPRGPSSLSTGVPQVSK